MVTIYDIAKKAGCSSSTVSKALNNSSTISKKRKEEIIAIAKLMGYVPNSNARQLATKNSWSIGILFSEDLNIGLEHHFFGGVLEAFKTYVEDLGYEVTFVSKKVGHQSLSYLEWCKYKNVDGVFIVTVDVDDVNLKELTESGIPIVTVDNGVLNVPTIISDNYQGTRMVLNYLRLKGAKNIAHIAGPMRSFAAQERIDAYRDVLTKAGVEIDEKLIIEANNYDFNSGKNALYQLVSQYGGVPDAIYAASDDIALGAIRALKELGYKVPEDVCVVGFDNIELTKYTSPALTTIAQDKVKIGREAAKHLIALINHEIESTPGIVKRVPVELVIRESTK
ncbi:LacI family DNA-binding transcriptional regulator [Proteiniclasticum sp. SCR006]|uniref:LacI family DNA-binding transcriptional regulator n=1 Tax=Proteiniclasticum aestuarii TaxID=2817862 RepID=A0A939HEP3_9CLOT|nr:LacI family DNA-binding transcriptional regulator [Proteiniclasticum aestuarii]MBO1265928.1 LacI family DNA-binding transcriptional regulator [Proteiniclasticum aestuarii]